MARTEYIELDTQVFGVYVGLLGYPLAGFRWTTAFEPSPHAPKRHSPKWGPWLVPVEGPGATGTPGYLEQRYPVFSDGRAVQLHRRFARLARLGADKLQPEVLAFANRYGWLGSHAERWPLVPRGKRTYTSLDCPRGESLKFWRSGIYELATFVALWDLLRFDRRDELAKYVVAAGSPRRVGVYAAWNKGRLTTNRDILGNDWGPPTIGQDMEPLPIAQEGTDLGDGRFQSFPEIAGQRPDVQTVTRLYLYDKVSEKLHGRVSPVLAPQRSAGEAFLLRPHSLLAAIYLYFARELSGRRAPGTSCANPMCNRTVDPTHGRRYCNDQCRDQARYYRNRETRRKPRPRTPAHTATNTNSSGH